MSDYYGHAPFPGGRFVDRVAVDGAVQPWADRTLRHVSRRWLGPVHLQSQGVEFHVRYVGLHEHLGRGAYPLHTHPHAEFLFTLAGRGAIHVPGRRAPERCEPGHLAAFPPGCASTATRCRPRQGSGRRSSTHLQMSRSLPSARAQSIAAASAPSMVKRSAGAAAPMAD